MTVPSDQYPEIPLNNREVCMGLLDMASKRVLKKIMYIHMAEEMELEEVFERCVLSLKILNGMTTKQLREALNGTDLRIYYTNE